MTAYNGSSGTAKPACCTSRLRQARVQAVALVLKKHTFEPIEPSQRCLDVAVGELKMRLFDCWVHNMTHAEGNPECTRRFRQPLVGAAIASGTSGITAIPKAASI